MAKYKLPNLSADQLAVKLRHIGACSLALRFCEGKDLKQALDKCENVGWILYYMPDAFVADALEIDQQFASERKKVSDEADAKRSAVISEYETRVRDIHASYQIAYALMDYSSESERQEQDRKLESIRKTAIGEAISKCDEDLESIRWDYAIAQHKVYKATCAAIKALIEVIDMPTEGDQP